MTKEDQDKMILDNIKLIYKVIKDLHCYWRTEDEWQDLYDCGLEGLINGVKKYNVSKSNSSTYLYRSIKNSILKKFYIEGFKGRRENKNCVSLNIPIGLDNENELMDLIPDTSINIENETDAKLKNEKILKLVNSLKSSKQKIVLKMYYGLDGYYPMTIEEISKILGISKNAVQQRRNTGLNKIRKELKCILMD